MTESRSTATIERPTAAPLAFGESLSSWFIEPQLNPANCVPEETVGAYPTLRKYGASPLRQQKIPREYFKMPADERDARIWALRRELGDRLVILGHHYQRDEVIQFADFRGDSFKLSQQAATVRTDAEYTLFCGVHFMAESADILSDAGSEGDPAEPRGRLLDGRHGQTQRCPGLLGYPRIPRRHRGRAGHLYELRRSDQGLLRPQRRHRLHLIERDAGSSTGPSSAARRSSSSRTSTSAATPASPKGIPTDEMVVWDPFLPMGGNTPEALQDAKVILWKGYCSVHARFSVEQIEQAREAFPDVNIIVHPECRMEVVQAADYNGSTERIIDVITAAPSGTVWGVGTEINLVNRLQKEMPDKTIFCLDPVICPCSTMYRIHPAYILWVLEHLVEGEVVNQITVDDDTRRDALVALDRMLAVP